MSVSTLQRIEYYVQECLEINPRIRYWPMFDMSGGNIKVRLN